MLVSVAAVVVIVVVASAVLSVDIADVGLFVRQI